MVSQSAGKIPEIIIMSSTLVTYMPLTFVSQNCLKNAAFFRGFGMNLHLEKIVWSNVNFDVKPTHFIACN